MPRSNSTWPAAAALLIALSTSSTTPSSAFVPLANTMARGSCSSRHTGTSLLPVAATPVSPTTQPAATSGGDSSSSNNNNNNNNNNNYNDLHEANKALDVLAMKCSNPILEPVISRADQCQSQWETMRGSSSSSLEPDTVSFNTVLKAWARCAQALADYKKHAEGNPPMMTSGSEGLQLSTSSDHPQVYTAKDAAERATLLLLSQEQDYDNGIIQASARPDTLSYNEAIGAWARSGVEEAPHNAERILKRMMDHEDLEPDGISYNGVVEAWAYSGKPESLQKVKLIWQKMEQVHAEAEGNENVKNPIKPTIRTVNIIIQAHSKRVQELVEARDPENARKTAREAEEFLDLMKERYAQTKDPDHMPDVMTYTTVMDAYGKCGRYHSTLKAESLLDELKDLYEKSGKSNPKLKPNVRTYTTLIAGWSKTRSPDSTREAERLLAEMLASEDPEIQPNARTFTAVIHTWGRSADHTKAQRALKLLQKMKELAKTTGRKDVAPTLASYNACLDACARCQGNLDQQTAALKIAFAVLKAVNLDPDMEASAITYSTLLRAISFLLEPGAQRNQVGKVVFEKAAKAGMVDFRVMLQLKKSVEASVLQGLLKGEVQQDRNGNFDFNAIPPGWNRNVR